MNALPDRRHAITCKLAPIDTETGLPISSRGVFATAGVDPQTLRVAEVFLRARGPEGSDINRLLDDVGELLSRALQAGASIDDLAAGFGRLGVAGSSLTPRSSIVGVVVDWLAAEQRAIDADFALDKKEQAHV